MTQVSVNRPTTSSAAVTVEHVSQRFSLRHEKTLKGLIVSAVKGTPSTETFLALDDINLEIDPGSTMGLIGHNGSGKSTLLKIIGGVMPPTAGQVTRRGRLAALLELGAGFHRDLSGRDNIFLNAEILGLSRSEIARKFDDIVDFSGVEQFIDTPMKFYSSGMFARLGFAVAIHVDPEVLLVDEVLAVGDEQFKAKCLDVIRGMQSDGKTIVLVTHSLGQVQEFCDRATMLHHGRVFAQGSPEDVIPQFRAQAESDRGKALRHRAETQQAGSGVSGKRHAGPVVGLVLATVDSGAPLADMRTGDTLVVDVQFTSGDSDPYVGVIALYSGSMLVCEVSTDSLGLDPFRGDARCVVRLLDLPLTAGRSYRLAVATARDRSAPALHRQSTAAQFSIGGSSPSSGPLAIRASAESVVET